MLQRFSPTVHNISFLETLAAYNLYDKLQDILWSYLKNHKSNAYNAPANG